MDDDFLNDDDFDYGDDDTISGDDEEEVDMENQYYSGKAAKSESDFAQAKACFEDVLNQEEEKGEWGFKALKQLMKMKFARKQFPEFIGYYQCSTT
ncbi:hypothetical protein L596_026367 [Steinernema carpocapsae]|uniref:COP9 signalosome complex subunit 2 n=1 Tax=Steinernema carpocapsae TaxID=34508 RepID=A0A4U5M249_STECR|nr:hypothetical protein L596_026367 [Steinernema carpocapsae]